MIIALVLVSFNLNESIFIWFLYQINQIWPKIITGEKKETWMMMMMALFHQYVLVQWKQNIKPIRLRIIFVRAHHHWAEKKITIIIYYYLDENESPGKTIKLTEKGMNPEQRNIKEWRIILQPMVGKIGMGKIENKEIFHLHYRLAFRAAGEERKLFPFFTRWLLLVLFLFHQASAPVFSIGFYLILFWFFTSNANPQT